jgi:predicted transcriptional regulator of viral defense system
MIQEMESTRSGTHSVHFLRSLAEEGRTVFTTSEARQLAERSGIPEGYVTNLLMLMVRNGWLTRLKRGIYSRSGPALGDVQVHSFSIATRMVTRHSQYAWRL